MQADGTVEDLIARGDFAAALPSLLAARDAAEKGRRRDRDAAAVLNNLGAVYIELGRTRDAQLAYEKSLAVWRDLGESDTPDAARTLGNLGMVYTKLNLLDKSEETLVRAGSLEDKLGDEIAAAKIWINLALVYKSERRWDEAEALLRKTLTIRERRLGPSDPEVALVLNNLGVLLQSEKRLAEAEPLLARALGIWEARVGPKHPWLAAGFNNAAVVDEALGHFDQAETHFKRAIEIASAELPADHPDLTSYRASYAHLLRRIGRKEEARKLEASVNRARQKHARENMDGYTVDARQLQH